MSDGRIELRIADGTARITIDRPGKLNAFAGGMRDDLADAIEQSAAARDVRVIVIGGAGRAFCAGADVAVMAELLERRDEPTFAAYVEAGARVVRAIAAAPKLVIAAVGGVAAGAGASLAAACDLRIASKGARIGFTFARIGLHPDWGATHFLPRLVGSGRAQDLIASARLLDANEAASIGLVERLVDEVEFEAAVAHVAGTLADMAPLPLARGKSILRGAPDALEAALRQEKEAQIAAFRSADVREGIRAFREKRPPRFTGE